MVRVTDSWQRIMSSSLVPLKTHRVGRVTHVKYVDVQTAPRWCGVEVRRGSWQLRWHSGHFTMVQKEVRLLKSLSS
ncbi:hypothetical protein TNCV_4532001 [Trichonephila clavipes]|nr:hypothetical protein TNCV_4532001 [Trichonephila clavipes]